MKDLTQAKERGCSQEGSLINAKVRKWKLLRRSVEIRKILICLEEFRCGFFLGGKWVGLCNLQSFSYDFLTPFYDFLKSYFLSLHPPHTQRPLRCRVLMAVSQSSGSPPSGKWETTQTSRDRLLPTIYIFGWL